MTLCVCGLHDLTKVYTEKKETILSLEYLNIGTNGKLMVLAVPIYKHNRVYLFFIPKNSSYPEPQITQIRGFVDKFRDIFLNFSSEKNMLWPLIRAASLRGHNIFMKNWPDLSYFKIVIKIDNIFSGDFSDQEVYNPLWSAE